MQDHASKLKDLTARRDQLVQSVGFLRGKLQNSQDSLAAARQKLLDRGIDPDNLDSYIADLETRLQSELSTLSASISEAEAIIAKVNQ